MTDRVQATMTGWLVWLLGLTLGVLLGHVFTARPDPVPPLGWGWCSETSLQRLEDQAYSCSVKLAACDPTAPAPPTPWP